MRERWWLAPLALAAAIAVAYSPLVTNEGVVITDDSFTSDITNGEWPERVEIGQAIREGVAPVWTRDIFGGAPLLPAGPGTEPLTIVLFALLPPVAAVNAYILFVLLLAATGTAVFARALGASSAGATIAGLSFVFSGYMVCQLKHLTIVSCIAWTPWALLAILRALEQPNSWPRTTKWLGVFSMVFGMQWLVGFAQSAYIAMLLYIGWGMTLIIKSRRWERVIAFGVAGLFGVCIGAIQLISSYDLSKLSDRNGGVSIEWATRWNYWLPQLWTFIVPYKNGDFSDHSYVGQSIFWEDYSYAGLITLLLALATLAWVRANGVRFWLVSGFVALLIALGKHTFVFSLAFHALPGLSFFRFPTRFLFVVHLAMSVLAALGLTHLEAWAARRTAQLGRVAPMLAWLLVGISFADLQFFQLRQNPIADADRWLSATPSTIFLNERLGDARAFSLAAKAAHAKAAVAAHGWSDLEPFYAMRDLVQANSNLLWNIEMADGYMGLLTRETSFLWGSSQVPSRVDALVTAAFRDETLFPQLAQVLRTFGVKYVLSPVPVPLGHPITLGSIVAYELPRAAERFHFAARTHRVETDDEAFTTMRLQAFDPLRDVIWVGGESGVSLGDPQQASLKVQTQSRLATTLEVSSPHQVLLINTETFHPHWVAEIDGKRVDIRRANINQRAILVPAGQHIVRFFFEAPAYRVGFAITLLSFLAATLTTLWAWRRPANP